MKVQPFIGKLLCQEVVGPWVVNFNPVHGTCEIYIFQIWIIDLRVLENLEEI